MRRQQLGQAAARDQAKRLGCELTKAKSGTRDISGFPVRYLIRDEYGLLFFRNLAQVKLWLRGRQYRLQRALIPQLPLPLAPLLLLLAPTDLRGLLVALRLALRGRRFVLRFAASGEGMRPSAIIVLASAKASFLSLTGFRLSRKQLAHRCRWPTRSSCAPSRRWSAPASIADKTQRQIEREIARSAARDAGTVIPPKAQEIPR
jgi:hypothetical protein